MGEAQPPGLERKLVRFKSRQDVEMYNYAVQTGHLVGVKEFMDEDCLNAYNWMKDQLLKRRNAAQLGPDEYPVWMWPADPFVEKLDIQKTVAAGALLDDPLVLVDLLVEGERVTLQLHHRTAWNPVLNADHTWVQSRVCVSCNCLERGEDLTGDKLVSVRLGVVADDPEPVAMVLLTDDIEVKVELYVRELLSSDPKWEVSRSSGYASYEHTETYFGVLLDIELPEDMVLASSVDHWCLLWMEFFTCRHKFRNWLEDGKEMYDHMLLKPYKRLKVVDDNSHTLQEMLESYEAIFDLKFLRACEEELRVYRKELGYCSDGEEEQLDIQYMTGRVPLDAIKTVSYYCG